MPRLNIDTLFEPRSIGIVADTFASGTHGGLALAALAGSASDIPVTLIGPAHASGPLRQAASPSDPDAAPAPTAAILRYGGRIEGRRRFAAAARRSARGKPVIVLKTGRHAPPAETGVWRVPPDHVYGAVFRRLGLVRAEGLADLFSAAEF